MESYDNLIKSDLKNTLNISTSKGFTSLATQLLIDRKVVASRTVASRSSHRECSPKEGPVNKNVPHTKRIICGYKSCFEVALKTTAS